MGKSVKKTLQEEYSNLKKVMKNILTRGNKNNLSQWVLQPVRNRQPGKKEGN